MVKHRSGRERRGQGLRGCCGNEGVARVRWERRERIRKNREGCIVYASLDTDVSMYHRSENC